MSVPSERGAIATTLRDLLETGELLPRITDPNVTRGVGWPKSRTEFGP